WCWAYTAPSFLFFYFAAFFGLINRFPLLLNLAAVVATVGVGLVLCVFPKNLTRPKCAATPK
ncbi:hypothetical protein, partial [Enorma sp.]|uniref:hypothetical protein n=1 Tax=Enorma sp. TaxID=1920692 RepID=UPI0025C1EA40